jgi:hypothetical protein
MIDVRVSVIRSKAERRQVTSPRWWQQEPAVQPAVEGDLWGALAIATHVVITVSQERADWETTYGTLPRQQLSVAT